MTLSWDSLPLFHVSALEVAKGQHDLRQLLGLLSGDDITPLAIRNVTQEVALDFMHAFGFSREEGLTLIGGDVRTIHAGQRCRANQGVVLSSLLVLWCDVAASFGHPQAKHALAVVIDHANRYGGNPQVAKEQMEMLTEQNEDVLSQLKKESLETRRDMFNCMRAAMVQEIGDYQL